jgi:hypothetical protein
MLSFLHILNEIELVTSSRKHYLLKVMNVPRGSNEKENCGFQEDELTLRTCG